MMLAKLVKKTIIGHNITIYFYHIAKEMYLNTTIGLLSAYK